MMITSEETVIAIPVKILTLHTKHHFKIKLKRTNQWPCIIGHSTNNLFKCNVVILKKKETQSG